MNTKTAIALEPGDIIKVGKSEASVVSVVITQTAEAAHVKIQTFNMTKDRFQNVEATEDRTFELVAF